MSSALQSLTDFVTRQDATLNHECSVAFKHDNRSTLVKMAATCIFSETLYYGNTKNTIDNLIREVANTHPEWLMKLAMWLREEQHLRTVLARIIAIGSTIPTCRPFIRTAFPRVCKRTDDLLNIAKQVKDDKGGLCQSSPHIIRSCMADSLANLQEYQAMKYRKKGKFGLKHLLKLYHPKPASKQQQLLYSWIIDARCWEKWSAEEQEMLPIISAFEQFKRTGIDDMDTLAETAKAGNLPWEMVISRCGSHQSAWRMVLKQMPIMALVRNLRNLITNGVLRDKELHNYVLSVLENREIILNSQQLPFRWLSAWQEIAPLDNQIGKALQNALQISLDVLPHWPGVTAIACDESASMEIPINKYSSVTAKDLANLLGAMIESLCDEGQLYLFGTDCIRVPDRKYCPEIFEEHLQNRNIMNRFEKLNQIGKKVGCGTEAYKVLSQLLTEEIFVDRLVYLTDMQIYSSQEDCFKIFAGNDRYLPALIKEYRKKINPNMQTIAINLQPYETFITPQDQEGVTNISGWSEGILGYIKDIDHGGWTLVDEIEKYK